MKIYNTLTRKKEEFKPVNEGKVGMYVCGPTVYDEPHIGHARSAYIFDVIRRYFEYRGFSVSFVRNVTDVDDKIIEKSKEEFKGEDLNKAVREVSAKYLKVYHEDMAALGIRPPGKEPKATEYVDKMVSFISGLIDRGAAYVSGGDVYFDIRKAKKYGKLSNQSIDRMKAGARLSHGENKKDPLDFALWKAARPEEPSWRSPWGRGRPGWHIECSVMSGDILGDTFDIHGGGIDLIFPHHENEIAQSEAGGKGFARYWMHNGLLTINNEKMAKSLGNFVTIKDFMSEYKNADYLKLIFLNTHYRSPVDYAADKVKEAGKAYERVDILMRKLDRAFGPGGAGGKIAGGSEKIKRFRDAFIGYMDDDFNTPRAMSVLFDVVNKCNKLLDGGKKSGDFPMLSRAGGFIKELTGVFGLTFLKETPEDRLEAWVNTAIEMRERFRKEKKYREADQLRGMLEDKGIILEDTKEGTVWRRKIS